MSIETIAATDKFNPNAANRHFVLNPLGDTSIIIKTSDRNMLVCAEAERIIQARDFGGEPEAQRLMAHFVREAENSGNALSITKTSLKKEHEKASTAALASSSTIAPKRTATDYAMSLELGGAQYADAIQAGYGMDLG